MAPRKPQPTPVLAAPSSVRVRGEWHARTLAEYRSCAVTHHLTLWLIQLGASPELITAGWRIASDELTHAQLSHEVFVHAGGATDADASRGSRPQLDRDDLQLLPRGDEPLEHALLRSCVEIFCLGETVAVPLFRQLRQGAKVPQARAVLDRVLRDEVRHRDFGWMLLAWLLHTPAGPVLRERVCAELPLMLSRLMNSYARPGDELETAIPQSDQAWGLMPTATYGEILRHALTHDFAPRFARLGITLPSPDSPR